MNIIDTTYRGIYSVNLNLNELSDRGINADKICITDGNDIILYATRGTLIAMRDKLNELFPPEPDEPESDLPEEPEPIEDGFYVTQYGTLIYRDSGNQPCKYIIYTNPPTYYYYWRHVYEDFDASAFPLTHVTVDDFRKLVRK